MKSILFIVIAILLGCNLERVEPETNSVGNSSKFKVVYGGPSNDFPKDILVTNDNNYVVLGYSLSFGNGNQIFAVGIDNAGKKLWQENYGGTGDENAFAALETTDKGFIFCGYSTSSSGFKKEVYVVKTDKLGKEEWKSNLDHFSFNEIGFGVIELPNKEYLIAYNNSDNLSVGITKLNSVGAELATTNKTIISNCNCSAKKVVLSSDNNLIFTGYKQSKHWIYKTDLNGIKIWEYTLSGLSSIGYTTIEAEDKSLYSVGSLKSNNNKEEFNLIHTNNLGVQIGTTVTWGGLLDDILLGVAKSPDGSYVVSGITDSYNTDSQIYLSKRNKDTGAEVWFKNFDETQWIWDDNYSLDIAACPDGGYILCAGLASAQSDFVIYKTDSQGNFK